jgi:predicted RND superfamily exporter protein
MENFILRIKRNKFATIVTTALVIVVGFILLQYLGFSTRNSSFGMKTLGSVSTYETQSFYDADSVSNSAPSLAPQAESSYRTPSLLGDVAGVEKKVVKNGSLSILIEKADNTAKKIQTIAESSGGSVDLVRLYNVTESTKAGQITIRVPNDKFNAVMDEIKSIATKVESEQVNTTDVTEQYVDLESNLTNYQAVEKRYLEILKTAKNVEETLSVYNRLTDIRRNIEVTKGRINYLSRQVAMSTITINLTSESDVKVFGIIWRPLTVLKQSFRNLLTDLTGIADWLIVAVFKLPGLLIKLAILFAIVFVVWKVFKAIKKRFIKRPQGISTQ